MSGSPCARAQSDHGLDVPYTESLDTLENIEEQQRV